jgi:lipoyl(octanoyl) transferase
MQAQPLEWVYLGRVDYLRALALQQAQADRVRAGAPPRLLLLEHPPTVTLGRQAETTNLKVSAEELARRGVGLHRVQRGGDVTYHGPGQLVGYPVVDLARLRLGVSAWVAGVAHGLVEFLARHGIDACWSELHPGVWVGGDKIAALGFQLAHRVSMHGFALNLDLDLSPFSWMVPCGLAHRGVTSVARLGKPVPSQPAAARELADLLARRWGLELGEPLEAARVLLESPDGEVRHACR